VISGKHNMSDRLLTERELSNTMKALVFTMILATVQKLCAVSKLSDPRFWVSCS